ncbi:hypothetical protein Ahy_A02g008516 [Arachis hypogaea]|uniref:Uncharacterized protein n=1 Tax=Arachis hypogaea TaxID=3818 RepID=A0A445EFA5_ARAHY|nr:hypothetical protein Ahy_A02g008516 [Arachis hypogaea]
MHYMSALKTSSNLFSLSWSGDVCLEVFLRGTIQSKPARGYITVAGEDVRTFDKSEWVLVKKYRAASQRAIQILEKLFGC